MLESSTPDTLPRIFAARTGQSERRATLPPPATPMTILIADGRQDVVITFGRHPKISLSTGGILPACALRRDAAVKWPLIAMSPRLARYQDHLPSRPRTLSPMMNCAPEIRLRKSTPDDGARVKEVWRQAVDAPHGFVTREDRGAIEAEVAAFPGTASLDLAVNEAGRVVGFMLLHGGHRGALFVDPDHRGCGGGRTLVEEALRRYPLLSTDVNEQNPQAVGFYAHLGFARIGRSPLASGGRPYPLIHLRYAK